MIKITQRETFEVIKAAVDKTVDLIKPTYGPAGNKVIISKVLEKMVVDDGVQIARSLELPDDQENAVLAVVRETAIRTNDRVGDGTTSSLIMLQAMINEVAKKTNRNGRKIEKELKKGFDEVKKQLLQLAVPVKGKEDLEKVARISFDDPKIAKIIADAWFQLGKDGVLTVDRSNTMETFAEVTEGIKIDRGYISPYMVTNPQRMEGVIEKPYILLTDYRLTEANDVLAIMSKMAEKNINSLVIIADHVEQSALATLIVNRMQGKFVTIAIDAPANGDDRTNFLEDISVMTGAKLFSQNKGDKLEEAEIKDLGRAERFISKKDTSVIIGPKGNKNQVQAAITDLRKGLESAQTESDKKYLKNRLSHFTNKVGVIKVGAATENEQRALRYKVEDAVNAVNAAFKGGIVCGAGIALAGLKTSSSILNEALQAPFRQLKDNMGLEDLRPLTEGEAVNAVTGKIGKYMEVGVIDPVDVLIAGVESAVSIASLLITTSGMIVEPPQKPKTE